MKKYIILFLLLAAGFSSEVYGQQVKTEKSDQRMEKRLMPKGFQDWDPLLPRRDTVIMRGEEVEVGGYLSEGGTKNFEIIGYGKAKKSDYKKGYYSIKLKPKQTTSYEFRWNRWDGSANPSRRIVYVAKTAEEKKRLEEKLKASFVSPFQLTTYEYRAPGSKVRIVDSGSKKAK